MSDSESRRGRFTPLKRLTDDELAAEAAGGNDKAFAALFERLQDPLYRYALSILGNPEEARDALQNAMLKAYRALRGETREIAARPWLYRIVRNESVSALRGRKPLGDLDEAVGVAAAGADVDAAARERLSDLVSDLRTLPERQRSALVLRELSGLDYEELGAALDISPNAARQTVFKARVSMQANVEGRTAHCDEVRAAMSKSDGRFRRRRSIQAHLERCPVCTEFAEGLERRPRDLAALFPPLPAGVAAGILSTVTAGGAGAAATEGGGAAATATGAAPRDDDRGRRRALVPLLLLLFLLLGGAVTMALLAGNAGDDSSSSDEVAQRQAGSAEGSDQAGTGADRDPGSGSGRSGSGNGGTEGSGSGDRDRSDSEREPGSDSESDSRSDSDQSGSGESGSGSDRSGSGNGGTEGSGSGGSGSGSGGSGSDRDTRSQEPRTRVVCEEREVARQSPAQEGYSNRAGRIEVELVEDCERVRRADCVPGRAGSGAGSGSQDGSGSGNRSGSRGGSGSGSGDGSGNGSGSGSGDSGSGSGDSGSGSGDDDGSGNGGDEGTGSGDDDGSGNGGGEGSGSGSGSGDGSGSGTAGANASGGACERTTASGLPITGLQLGLIAGCALLLLTLGVSLRRLART